MFWGFCGTQIPLSPSLQTELQILFIIEMRYRSLYRTCEKKNGEAELFSAQTGDCSTLASFANESLKAFTCQERKTHTKEFSTELGLLSF